MGDEREKTELRPEEVDSDAEKLRDLDVTEKEGDAVKGGLARRGGDDDDLSDLEIQR